RPHCRPKADDLPARTANIANANGMVGSRPDPFPETNVGHEAQITVGNAEGAILRFQEQLLHRHHVTRHFPPDFAPPQSSLLPFPARRIRGLCDPEDACTDTTTAPATADNEIGAD